MNMNYKSSLTKWNVLIILIITSVTGFAQSFNVMSFNIRLPHKGDGLHYWDHRRPLVVSTIRYHEADLIGVQEAFRRQLDELMTDLEGYAWTGLCRTDGTKNPNPDNEFSAILYRKNRFAVLEEGTFWLSETPEKAGSLGWDAAYPRIVSWAKFKDQSTGKTFYHFNTHFDHMGVTARIESSKLILKKIKEIAGSSPVVLSGDFNTAENDKPYQTIIDPTSTQHLDDALWKSTLSHHGPMSSFAGTFEISGLQPNRIDFIFVNKGVKVLKHAILTDSWNGFLPSDHLPVFAEIEIE